MLRLWRRREEDMRYLVDRPTMFGRARVYDVPDEDGATMRVLDVEGTWQSACRLDQHAGELAFRYHRLFADMLECRGLRGGRALMLGGGGFAFPAWLLAHDPEVRVDAVEVDPDIIDIAERWLSLSQLSDEERGRLDIVCADAVSWLSAQVGEGARYGLVVNDLFAAERPTAALMDADGAHLVHNALAPEGLYLANVVSALRGSRGRALRRVLDALDGAFEHLRVLPLGSDEPRKIDNNIVIASDADLDWLA